MVFKRNADARPAANEIPFALPAARPEAAQRNQAPPPPGLPGQVYARAQAQNGSVIGNDLSIEGQSITIRCRGSLRVNGNIEADLHSIELVVGEGASIRGSITAETVEVYGKVDGAIRGTRVVLHASAEVDGEIQSQNFAIEQGASFEGRSRKVNDPAEIAPQLTPGGQSGPPPLA